MINFHNVKNLIYFNELNKNYMYTIIKTDGSMKKLILTIIATAFISTLSLQASSKVEVITNKTISIKMNKQKSNLTIDMCKKQLGIDNYNFIKEVYNDENIVMKKCKEALIK